MRVKSLVALGHSGQATEDRPSERGDVESGEQPGHSRPRSQVKEFGFPPKCTGSYTSLTRRWQ